MISLEVKGDRQLQKKLARLQKDTQKNKALRKGARAAAKIIQKEAKSLAPKDSGKLKKSIKVRSLKRSRRWVGAKVVSEFKEGEYYGWAVHQLEVEFMFNAEQNKHSQATQEFVSVAGKEIDKLLQRG